ncbi:MAG: restriction endonuclease subunit S [Spirochaetaceae bacterium]|jgi:hypothetical protein|nr:restriction endonuclease subunit S [Spirochaetaceae bacterium]
MTLGDCTAIRTGLVLSRKEAPPDETWYRYTALSLKNISECGTIRSGGLVNYCAVEPLKNGYFTHCNDVLLRLSAPYTAVLITSNEAGLLVPSHFAIIRADETVNPRYLHWWLTQNRKHFYKAASGGTMMGTISSGYVADMVFNPPSREVQQKLGVLLQLVDRERQLLILLGAKKTRFINAALNKILKD